MTVKQVANSSGWRSSSKSETAQECMTSCAVQSNQIPCGKKVWSKLKFTDETTTFINCIIYVIILVLT